MVSDPHHQMKNVSRAGSSIGEATWPEGNGLFLKCHAVFRKNSRLAGLASSDASYAVIKIEIGIRSPEPGIQLTGLVRSGRQLEGSQE
jgi:hypothetical protein